jgi:CDP-2,3-bis-(O-geranylgeranyl)-sn-glycerol synthase
MNRYPREKGAHRCYEVWGIIAKARPIEQPSQGLDQIPGSLLPLLACTFILPLTLLDLVAATVIFFVGELALSRLLFKLRIRYRPY